MNVKTKAQLFKNNLNTCRVDSSGYGQLRNLWKFMLCIDSNGGSIDSNHLHWLQIPIMICSSNNYKASFSWERILWWFPNCNDDSRILYLSWSLVSVGLSLSLFPWYLVPGLCLSLFVSFSGKQLLIHRSAPFLQHCSTLQPQDVELSLPRERSLSPALRQFGKPPLESVKTHHKYHHQQWFAALLVFSYSISIWEISGRQPFPRDPYSDQNRRLWRLERLGPQLVQSSSPAWWQWGPPASPPPSCWSWRRPGRWSQGRGGATRCGPGQELSDPRCSSLHGWRTGSCTHRGLLVTLPAAFSSSSKAKKSPQ